MGAEESGKAGAFLMNAKIPAPQTPGSGQKCLQPCDSVFTGSEAIKTDQTELTGK